MLYITLQLKHMWIDTRRFLTCPPNSSSKPGAHSQHTSTPKQQWPVGHTLPVRLHGWSSSRSYFNLTHAAWTWSLFPPVLQFYDPTAAVCAYGVMCPFCMLAAKAYGLDSSYSAQGNRTLCLWASVLWHPDTAASCSLVYKVRHYFFSLKKIPPSEFRKPWRSWGACIYPVWKS